MSKIVEIRDLEQQPGFNRASQNGRGDWSLRDVTGGGVFIAEGESTPSCIDHRAMNSVSPQRDIWRCLACGRACYVVRA